MATVNFSVPEDVKQAIDKAFAGHNTGEINLFAPVHFQAEVCAVLAGEAPEAMWRQLA